MRTREDEPPLGVEGIDHHERTSRDLELAAGPALDFVAVRTPHAANLLTHGRALERETDPRGPWIGSDLDARNFYSKGEYSIALPSGRTIPGPPTGRYWTVSHEKLRALDADKRVWWGDGDTEPQVKRFLSEVKEGVVPQTIWNWEDVGSTRHAKSELVTILGRASDDEDVFVTPKPVQLIRHILTLATEKDALVLDSFAGSGTTAHAVLAHNREDGGERRFILVQQSHDTSEDRQKRVNICDSVTAERVRRAIIGYSYARRRPKGKSTKAKEAGLGGSFTYARVGAPLLGDNRSWGERMPTYEELARYIFFTETARELEPKKGSAKTGKIGEHGGASYYLLYTPDPKASVPFDQKVIDTLAKDPNPRKVVYCEKVWVHREDLARLRKEMEGLGEVRTMLLPFQVRTS